MLSREFFYQFEDEITRARYEIDEKYHMGIRDLRKALGFLSEETTISIKDEGETVVYRIGDKEITAPSVKPVEEVAADYLRGMNPFEENRQMSAPAQGSFAAAIRGMMDEARAGVAKAREDGLARVGDAVGKLNEAKVATVTVAGSMARTIEEEAAAVMAELGQISNSLGGENE